MSRTLDLDTITLGKGIHTSMDDGACVMECVAYVAGEPWSDSPSCVSPILAGYLRDLNDAMGDEQRQQLKPLIQLVIGTRGTDDDEQARGLLAMDWLVREYTPAGLALAGLTQEAAALRALPPITSWDRLVESMTDLRAAAQRADAAWAAARAAARAAAWAAARDAAWAAARDAAWAAAWAAAGDAARAAAWAAAWDAAWAAAVGAARDAAWAAAWAAARAAAWAAAGDAAVDAAGGALAPTVARLQASAIDLAKRMAAVGSKETT